MRISARFSHPVYVGAAVAARSLIWFESAGAAALELRAGAGGREVVRERLSGLPVAAGEVDEQRPRRLPRTVELRRLVRETRPLGSVVTPVGTSC